MPWWIWSIISSFCGIGIECLNHGAGRGASWLAVLPKTIWLIILLQYSLYRAWNGGSHLLSVWAVFFLANAILRVVAVKYYFHGEIGNWFLIALGVGLIAGGGFAINLGKMSPN